MILIYISLNIVILMSSNNLLNTYDNLLITTAISYTNGSPHIGHLYESVLADFLTKSFGLFNNVKLLTGTDEHGKKIETTALSQGISPIELCNRNSQKFKQLNDKLGVEYNHFIRTTDPAHKELVSKSIQASNLSGDIYLDHYTGYYNVREECFVSELEASQINYLDLVTGKPLEKITEESYFFRLSKYKDYIKQINEAGLVYPSGCFSSDSRLDTLKDLSISRTSFNWGIKFPELPNEKLDDNKHIVYVWFDALLNYVTGSDIIYGLKSNSNSNKIIHLIGKDIVWFHSVIYPAILKSCAYDKDNQAKNILVHGFVQDKNGIKMSKSLGNVIDPDELFNKYPVEAIRYYLVMETIWGEDIRFNEDRLKDLYNNQLIKDFGNLFQRLFTLAKPIVHELNTYFDSNKDVINELHNKFLTELKQIIETYSHAQYKALMSSKCAHANKELTDKKPWEKSVNTETRVKLIATLLIELKQIMLLHYPIIPDKINQLAGYLGWSANIEPNFKLNICEDKIKAFLAI